MNPNNYASLAASKRLVEAGIVLETEVVWTTDGLDWVLMSRDRCGSWMQGIPAPSMAEVWRELPEASAYLHTNKETEVWLEDEEDIIPKSNSFADTNPTDSLIYLLIWVRKEASHE